MTISSMSRNALAPTFQIFDADGKALSPLRVDIRESIDPTLLPSLQQFSYVSGQQWAQLGLKYLGDARHWWVIAELSGVMDPFDTVPAGTQLTTPSFESLYLDILHKG